MALDTSIHGISRDQELDAVCRIASALFHVPYAFVSQLDDEYQCFLGREGLGMAGTPREIAFCAITVLGRTHEPTVVLDTLQDPRFATNPLVTGAPFLRFYAGVPIALGGKNVCTVCIADSVPRATFSTVEVRRLCDLALFVEATLRARVAHADARQARDLTAAAASLLRTTLENMDQGLLMTDAEDRVRIYNFHVATLMGVPERLFYDGAPFAAVRAYQREAGEFDQLPDALRAWLEHGNREAYVSEYERVRADGTVLHVRTRPLPEGGFVRTFTDVTAHRAAEAARQASEARYRLLAENANDVIILSDITFRRLYVSPAVRTVLGYEPQDLLGTTIEDFCHPDDAEKLAEHRSQIINSLENRFVVCLRHRHKAGHYVWIESSVRALLETEAGDQIKYVVALRDISKRQETEQQIRHMALHDALTGLPNRTMFYDRLDQAIAHSASSLRPFAVLACDLDRFKAVNDSFGHPFGDALLRVVADRMRGVLRPYDTVARLGGDEFAILLAPLDALFAADHYAERLIAAVSAPVEIDGKVMEVGVSIGLTVALAPDVSANELFKRADIALYEAKAGGRNTYREFCPHAGARIATRGQLGLEMKEAMRRGEFHLVYQPVVEAKTGTVVAFEALMRWNHSLRGTVSPVEFIPVAEETNLIVSLGGWALEEACREAMTWPVALCVAVNVSVVQLRRGGLEMAVLVALATSGLPAHRLKLEVTESVLMEDADTVLMSLHRLRALGVLVALDDFGTGFSSLSYLRRFPFDQIKIDRTFIRDIAHPDAAAIVRAVVSISERLGMGIVAEGVETQEQLELVRREGCDQVQGFLFSRPLSREEARMHIQTQISKAA